MARDYLILKRASASRPSGDLAWRWRVRAPKFPPPSDQINIGLIVDFQNKRVMGLSDSVLTIDSASNYRVFVLSSPR